MTKTLRISADLLLPLELIQHTTVVYGARGTGKTVFGSVLGEETAKNRQRFCAIDLKGDFYGLKSSADGKSAALPIIIFGGDHADVPLEPDAGAFIGETVAHIGQSCVLDLEHMSKGKQVRFLAAFFSSLYDHNRDPILLLLDECQRYAPQKPIDPDAAKCLGAVEDLVKLGRKHGIGLVLTTQRGSSLNKEVSELCDLLVAFRTPGPLDQERIKGWLDANTTKAERESVMSKLAGLPTGTAVFASGHPSLKLFGVHRVRMRETFDSSATPKIGERRKEPKALATADLTALREKMAAAIERAKQDDPKALRVELAAQRKRVAELERELQREKDRKPEGKTKTVDKPVLRDSDLAAFDRMLVKIDGEIAEFKELVAKLDEPASKLREAARIARATSPVNMPSPLQPTAQRGFVHDGGGPRAARPVTMTRPTNGHAASSEVGNSGLRRMLVALAQRPQGLTNRQIGIRAGISSKSGTFATYLSRARQQGWVEDCGPARLITEAGIAALGHYEPLPTGQALLEYWIGELGQSGAARILGAIARAYPRALSNAEIGEAAEISAASGTFATYMSRLRGLELVQGSRGATKASDELFD